MDYYALKWEKRSIFGEINDKFPFGKELQALSTPRNTYFSVKEWCRKACKREIEAGAA